MDSEDSSTASGDDSLSHSPSRRTEIDFELSGFIKENSPLFTVMGIFGAISVYLSQIGERLTESNVSPAHGEIIINSGIAASLMLFLYIGYKIQRLAFSSLEEQSLSPFALYIVDYSLSSKPARELNIFFIPLYILMFSTAYIALSQPGPLIIFMKIGGFLVGAMSLSFIRNVAFGINYRYGFGFPKQYEIRAIYIVVGFAMFVFAHVVSLVMTVVLNQKLTLFNAHMLYYVIDAPIASLIWNFSSSIYVFGVIISIFDIITSTTSIVLGILLRRYYDKSFFDVVEQIQRYF